MAAAEQQSLRLETYSSSAANAVQWHEADKDASNADAFGAALHGNAAWRPQMTPLAAGPTAALALPAGGLSGSVIITGAGDSFKAYSCHVTSSAMPD